MELGLPGEDAAGVLVSPSHIEPLLVCSENTLQHQVFFVLCPRGLLLGPKGWLPNAHGGLFLRLAPGFSRSIRLFDWMSGAFDTCLNSRSIAQKPANSFSILPSSASCVLFHCSALVGFQRPKRYTFSKIMMKSIHGKHWKSKCFAHMHKTRRTQKARKANLPGFWLSVVGDQRPTCPQAVPIRQGRLQQRYRFCLRLGWTVSPPKRSRPHR